MSDAKITWQPGDVVKYGDLNPLFVAAGWLDPTAAEQLRAERVADIAALDARIRQLLPVVEAARELRTDSILSALADHIASINPADTQRVEFWQGVFNEIWAFGELVDALPDTPDGGGT